MTGAEREDTLMEQEDGEVGGSSPCAITCEGSRPIARVGEELLVKVCA